MARVFVGNLPEDIRKHEIDDLFHKYGRIRDIDIKVARSGRGAFAFLEFDDDRDADDAVRGRNGYEFDRMPLRVEIARGGRGRGPAGGSGGRPAARTEWRVKITGLPPSASWQDIKDFVRPAGEPCFAEVDRRGGGTVEFFHEEDMRRVIRKLDDTEFDNRYDRAIVRVGEDRGDDRGRGRSRSPPGRSPPRGRSRSRSRSPRDRSRSPPGRSPPRGRSRSRSRSPRDRSRSPPGRSPPRDEPPKDEDRREPSDDERRD